MRVKKNKDGSKVYSYTGSLEKEIEYCEREIEKKREELKIWTPVYEKMKHEVDYRTKRIQECIDFIVLAKQKLAEKQKGEENNG